MNPDLQRPPEEGEEIEHYDDAIIGKAFRWSALAVICLALLGGAFFFYLRREPAPPPPQVTTLEAPAPSRPEPDVISRKLPFPSFS